MSAALAFRFRDFDPEVDSVLLHDWVTREYARFWGMTGTSPEGVRTEYRALLAIDGYRVRWGLLGDREVFLVEDYAPETSPLAGHEALRPGDRGMHLLVGPPKGEGTRGFTAAVMDAVLRELFVDQRTARIVVEPDVRNTAVQRLNARLGFRVHGSVALPDKEGLLSFCSRGDFLAASSALAARNTSSLRTPRGERHERPGIPFTASSPTASTAHLTPQAWEDANRHVLAKALGEFAHERILEPHAGSDGRYEVTTDDGATGWRFAARRYALDHWVVEPASIEGWTREESGVTELAPDVAQFVSLQQERLGIPRELLPVYLEELWSTLSGRAAKGAAPRPSSAELAAGHGADRAEAFQAVEAAMTEGHPCFVANNGRLGLGARDYWVWAPEHGRPGRLYWLAVHESAATFTSVTGLDQETLLKEELGTAQLERFRHQLSAAGHEPGEYVLMPVHPWQWDAKLAVAFAPEIASSRLILLGESADAYQPQQSIRTFFNRSRPESRYVKTAMSVLNMGFMRGLSAEYMEPTPAINEWLSEIVDADPELSSRGFTLLRECAAVGYRHAGLEAVTVKGSPYRKMLAALWRESPIARTAPEEHLATMASLLHVDDDGASLAVAFIERSGLPPREWLRRYLEAYLIPVVHCLARHELAFMPHGENVIMVLRDGVPTRVFMKDIAEEIAVMGDSLPVPEGISRVHIPVPREEQVLSVFTDVFDCFFRFLAPLLDAAGTLPEKAFWEEVSGALLAYRNAHPEDPEHAAAFDELGLFDAELPLSCLNRLQLKDNRQMVDIADVSGSLQYAGTLANPVAAFAARASLR